MVGVEITRTDMTAAELRAAARGATDGRAARRMLALALVLEGADRGDRCGDLRDGPADVARLGAPLQRRGAVRALQPPLAREAATAFGRRRRPRSPRRWRRVPTRRSTGWCTGGALI